MSFSLAIVDGDLSQKGSSLDLVFGKEKLNQDLYLWIMERYGADRFHVNMGSILQEFIGSIVTESSWAEVHAEIFRILQNYQALQLRRFQEHPELLSISELLVSVDEIITRMSYDTVNVTIKVRNGSEDNSTIKIMQTV